MQRPQAAQRWSVAPSSRQTALQTHALYSESNEHRSNNQCNELNQPRRPKTTPKPRIQRLLSTPGDSTRHEWNRLGHSMTLPPSTLLHLPNSPPRLPSIHSTNASNETHVGGNEEEETMFHTQPSLGSPIKCPSDRSNDEEHGGNLALSVDTDIGIDTAGTPGPLLIDIEHEVAVDGTEVHYNDDHEDVEEKDSDDDDYKQALAYRNQLLRDEADRQRIRAELETYVGSLGSRMDESGDHLVHFPPNYQQIVSLMTPKDVCEEDVMAQEGQHTRQSWSRVLIEAGLSKQQAFGILEDVDDDLEGNNSLAAKIALKMARIRQLDTILEEKLGKNLYSSIMPRKQKKTQSQPQSTGSSSRRTLVMRTQAIASSTSLTGTSRSSISTRNPSLNGDDKDLEHKKSNYFIERNKQIVANGMKAKMTKDEEDRLEKLLRREVVRDNEDHIKPESSSGSEERNEFAMPDIDKKAIEELVALKSGTHALFAIDEEGFTEEALLPSDANTCSTTDNIIQATKSERLQRNRLSRVEQELRFLQESPSVIIVGDNDDEDDRNDDCRSEQSYATMASSTCSSRSGVISRHDFKCFLARQKEEFQATSIASADEIRQLLLTIGHGSVPPSNVMAAATG